MTFDSCSSVIPCICQDRLGYVAVISRPQISLPQSYKYFSLFHVTIDTGLPGVILPTHLADGEARFSSAAGHCDRGNQRGRSPVSEAQAKLWLEAVCKHYHQCPSLSPVLISSSVCFYATTVAGEIE